MSHLCTTRSLGWGALFDSWAGSACYPRRTFYPLSDGPSIQNRRITNSYFRTCSTCLSHSQAGLCVYTLRLISKQPEPTFERLRYNLGNGVRLGNGNLYFISGMT